MGEHTWKITVVEHCYFMDVGRGQSFYGAHNDGNADEKADQPGNVSIIQGNGHNLLVDTGFGSEHFINMCNSKHMLKPEEYLEVVGLKPEDIEAVFISHMHYDHVDYIDSFKNAQVYVQKAEYEGWKKTKNLSEKYSLLKCYLEETTIEKFENIEKQGRLQLLEDNVEVYPGIKAYLTPGHSFGDQTIVVETTNGSVAVCGDSAYTVENITRMTPMGYGFSQIQMLESFEKIYGLVGGREENIIPGHDLIWPDKYPNTKAIAGKRNRITVLWEN